MVNDVLARGRRQAADECGKSSGRATPRRRLARLGGQVLSARVPATAVLALLSCAFAPAVLAQASAPVTSSVFTHPVTDPSGGESGAINENWKFITSPPAHPVAASEPEQDHSQRRGGGKRGGGGSRGSQQAASDTAATTQPDGSGIPGGLPPALPVPSGAAPVGQ